MRRFQQEDASNMRRHFSSLLGIYRAHNKKTFPVSTEMQFESLEEGWS